MDMGLVLKKASLGIALILAVSAALLLSDLKRREPRKSDVPRMALFQFTSNPLLDDTVRGVLEGLHAAGYREGRNIDLRRYNSEGDMPTANAIAHELTSGRFDLIATVSTVCLQVVAGANREGRTIHIFGAVTDPCGAGVGITGSNPADHPPYLAGIGTFQPVERSIEVARQMYPGLKRLGVVWNPTEKCSEACTIKARRTCSELAITLMEATVDSSAGVSEAAASLVGRGAEAIWVGGDNTVSAAIDAVVKSAASNRIPVFTNSPSDVKRGAAFALGADYVDVGRRVGDLSGRVLKGASPAEVAIRNVVPERLCINLVALKNLAAPWVASTDLLEQAAEQITDQGLKTREDRVAGLPRG
jgi:ABC-type uncharacterized transport system substrate-binding protein